jgi:pyrroline-5-carboxylate reductase
MNIQSVGFIGCGRIARILFGGFRAAGVALPSVVASDLNPENIDKLRANFPQIHSAGSDNAKPAAQQVVLLAVHPPAIDSVLSDIKARSDPRHPCVACPKFTTAKLSEALGGFNRVARMIPNAPPSLPQATIQWLSVWGCRLRRRTAWRAAPLEVPRSCGVQAKLLRF